MEERAVKAHKITFYNRKNGMISGVKDVISFDLNEVVLDTEQGMLAIHGENLHVTRLTVEKGEVELEGVIDSLAYSNVDMETGKESLLRRLFR